MPNKKEEKQEEIQEHTESELKKCLNKLARERKKIKILDWVKDSAQLLLGVVFIYTGSQVPEAEIDTKWLKASNVVIILGIFMVIMVFFGSFIKKFILRDSK